MGKFNVSDLVKWIKDADLEEVLQAAAMVKIKVRTHIAIRAFKAGFRPLGMVPEDEHDAEQCQIDALKDIVEELME